MKIEKGDFVEIEYLCRVKETGEIAEISKGRIIIPVGKGFLPEYLEKLVIGKEIGKEYNIEVPPEDAYGRRDEKLVKIIPLSSFKKNRITPIPGMIVSIDGILAIVRSVSGGRVVVDFNHPFAGKTILAYFKVYRKITDLKEKVEGLLNHILGETKYKLEIDEQNKSIKIVLTDNIKENIKKVVVDILKNNIEELKEYKIELLANQNQNK